MAVTCARCGAKQGLVGMLTADLGGKPYYCDLCTYAVHAEEKDRRTKLLEVAEQVVLTTTPGIDGCRVAKYLGIESVEFVIGTGLFSELTTEFSDFFGRRSTAFEKKLSDAKSYAMKAMKILAAEKGANAVVAIDLDYTEFSGNRVGLILNGTLVLTEPISETAPPGGAAGDADSGLIKVRCDSCSKMFRIKVEHAGKRIKCPACGTAMDIPK